jgi:hypothetical protein
MGPERVFEEGLALLGAGIEAHRLKTNHVRPNPLSRPVASCTRPDVEPFAIESGCLGAARYPSRAVPRDLV